MNVSNNFYELLEEFEGRENSVYLDSGGAPTIGIGHLLTRSERNSGKIYIGGIPISYGKGLTDKQINALARNDVNKAVLTVDMNVRVILTPYQFDALVSFTFNVGNTAFRNSTLLRLLNQGMYDEVPTQMRRWNKDNGRIVQGLINRRELEITHWLNIS